MRSLFRRVFRDHQRAWLVLFVFGLEATLLATSFVTRDSAPELLPLVILLFSIPIGMLLVAWR